MAIISQLTKEEKEKIFKLLQSIEERQKLIEEKLKKLGVKNDQ